MHFEIFKMDYKLVFTDIDGTLLNKDRELSESTIQEVKRISPTPFVLISSRMPRAMRHLQGQLGNLETPFIAYNGGLVINKGEILHSQCISNTVLKKAIELSENTSIHLSLYNNDDWYVPEMDYWAKREQRNTKVVPTVKSNASVLNDWISKGKGAHKIMCMGDEREIGLLFDALEDLFSDEIILYRSKPTYIEISHRSISKKTAISLLLENEFTQNTPDEVIAFGDNYNDIEMLKYVGLGIAVGNANDEVLAVADVVTDTNKNDGVAKSLKDLFE